MKVNESLWAASSCGNSLALGIAWHLDYGFWSILGDALLGWIYVGYKVAQFVWPFG